MSKIVIPFIKSKLDIPVVSLYINDCRVEAIIDTGSESTLIDKTFAKEHKKLFHISTHTDKCMYFGFNSSTEHPVIIAETVIGFKEKEKAISIAGEVFNLDSVISAIKETYDIEPKLIIGSDFLNKFSTEINYETRQLILMTDDLSC